jgi:hypothetical protein
MSAYMPQYLSFDISCAAMRIKQFATQGVVHDGVDGKIPSGGCFREAQPGIDLNEKSPVSGPGLVFPPGQRNIKIKMLDFDNAETHSDSIDLAALPEQFQHPFGGKVMDLKIKIFDLPSHESISDCAADEQSTPPGRRKNSGKLQNFLEEPAGIF